MLVLFLTALTAVCSVATLVIILVNISGDDEL
jgi:hypothetical protein